MSLSSHAHSILWQDFVGKKIQVIEYYEFSPLRQGIITDLLEDKDDANILDIVILWDEDKNEYLDSEGKMVYDMFDPVSVIPIVDIANPKLFEIMK